MTHNGGNPRTTAKGRSNKIDPNRHREIVEVTTRKEFEKGRVHKLRQARIDIEEATREQQRRDDSRIPGAGHRHMTPRPSWPS